LHALLPSTLSGFLCIVGSRGLSLHGLAARKFEVIQAILLRFCRLVRVYD